MPPAVTISAIDRVKDVVFSVAQEYPRRLRDARHCDIRLGVREGKEARAENGQVKGSSEEYGLALGVRVLAGRGLGAPGYYGSTLGAADLEDLPRLLRGAVQHAHARALANASRKARAREAFGALGQSLHDSQLAPVPVRQDQVPARYRVDPRSVPLPTVSGFAGEACRAMRGVSGSIAYTAVGVGTAVIRELFASSEGALVDQARARTEGLALVVAVGPHGPLELYDFAGHQGGWEVMGEGVHQGAIDLPDFRTFATNLAREATEVAAAEPLRPPDREAVVVTDPHFNALVVHEVVGHPSELDRALKYETSYAGRSWFLRDLAHHQKGRQVASPLVSVFSDPAMDGFGHYLYDHEGTPARRVYHIRQGVYEEFMNSRQTAAIVGAEPNGHYVATDAALIPLIRMSNTVFAPGERDPQEILQEVDHGYYVVGHRIPSVAESRENFRISAMKVYEIRQGELGQLYRDGGIMSDSRDYFMRVDAVGRDFRLYPIPNCGKGQPMQAKRMGNGGPTMRSVARLMGVSR